MSFEICPKVADLHVFLKESGYKQTSKVYRYTDYNNLQQPHVDLLALPSEPHATSITNLNAKFINHEHGVKLEFSASIAPFNPNGGHVDSITIEVLTRTDRGTFVKHTRYDFTRQSHQQNFYTPKGQVPLTPEELNAKAEADAKLWVATIKKDIAKCRGQEVTNPPIKNKNGLYPPLRFETSTLASNKEAVEAKTARYLVAQSRQVLRTARVDGLVSVDGNLKLNKLGITKPNEECWFHIVGEIAETTSTAELIATEREGELVFYPIGGTKITNNFSPRNMPIDYKKMTIGDRELIEFAINEYVRGIKE